MKEHQQKEHDMRRDVRKIMNDSWRLARKGAERFGDGPGMYIRSALRITWLDHRTFAVSRPRVGEQYLMGFVLQMEVQ